MIDRDEPATETREGACKIHGSLCKGKEVAITGESENQKGKLCRNES